MFLIRRSGAAISALSLVVLASCIDSEVVGPDLETRGVASLAILDGTTTGSPGFYFLPPISLINPSTEGEFNPDLAPSVHVCELDGEPGTQSSCQTTVADFPPGSVDVQVDRYVLDWDTNGPETARLRRNRYYRLEVMVADLVLGWVDLNPKNDEPNSYAYDFRIGETIPVKFFINTQALCTGEEFVTECISGSVIDQTGGTLTLEDEGNRLGVIIAQNSLPAPFDAITVTVERINPVAFFNATGQQCIPGINGFGVAGGTFGAPQFGDCFRVRTFPELVDPLTQQAVVSICLNVSGLGLSAQQVEQLRMVKFDDDSNEEWVALQETAGDCPTQQASLFDVPESGLLRYAALGANAIANLVGVQPVEARFTRFGGLNSSFSRFRFALPGQMAATEGDGAIIQIADDNTITATINVVDAGDDDGLNRQPVAGALVHFEPAPGAGTVSASEVVTDAAGNASVQWTVDRSTVGAKALNASALGLFSGPVPDPDGTPYDFLAETVTITATVVGPPAALGQNPTGNIDDAVAGAPEPLTVIVTDAASSPVQGATVTWTCTPICTFGEGTQNPDGSATTTSVSNAAGQAMIQWTPLTAGSQVSVASVDFEGVADATFTATVAPADAVEPAYPTPPATGTVGLTLDPLVIEVTDAFGNARVGDVVTWTVTGGDGSVSSTTTNIGPDGTSEVDWTLGQLVGLNTLTVAVGSFSTTLSVTGEPGPAVNIAQTGAGDEYGGGTALPLTVTVTDQYGNARVGDAVNWWVAGGTITADATTGVGGVAAATWTLGTVAGDFTGTASVEGLQAIFTATVTGCEVTVDGIVSEGEWDCALDDDDVETFTANVGGDRPAEVRWQQTGDEIFFLVRVQTTDDLELRLDFDNTLNGPSADDDAIGYRSTGGFYDQYLTRRCVNRSQAGCGSADRNGQDGAAASAIDGSYRVYELSHPLAGDGVEDFNRASGDQLGFFLTFRNGQGAKGNSEFPGFRNYQTIDIR